MPFYTCYLAEQVPVCARLQFVLVLLAAEENSEFVLGTSQGCLGTSWHVLARLGSDMTCLGRGVWTVAGGTMLLVLCVLLVVCVL